MAVTEVYAVAQAGEGDRGWLVRSRHPRGGGGQIVSRETLASFSLGSLVSASWSRPPAFPVVFRGSTRIAGLSATAATRAQTPVSGRFWSRQPRRYQLTNRHGARWFFGRTRTPPTSLIGQVDNARTPAPAGRESALWRSPRGISTYRVGSRSRDTRDPRASFLSRRRHPGAVRGVPAAPRDSRCSRSRARKHANTR